MNSFQSNVTQLVIPWWKPLHVHDKPPYSYATLIAHALLSSDQGQMKLHEIYSWISQHYPFYELGGRGWQNSIRHNLSLNKKRFVRIKTTKHAKGNYWKLVPGTEKQFKRVLTRKWGPIVRREDLGCQHQVEKMNRQGQLFTSFKHESTLMPLFITVPEDYQLKGKIRKPRLLARSSSSSPPPSLSFSREDHSDTDEGSLPATPCISGFPNNSNAALLFTQQDWTQQDVFRLTSTPLPTFDSSSKSILLDPSDDMIDLDQFICFDM